MNPVTPHQNDNSSGSAGKRFATTSWSMVVRAGDQPSDQSRLALEQLCQQYWYPLYVFVRRKGHSRDAAEEITQGFFAHLLDRDRLQFADQQKGRFRSFLIRSLENFIIQNWRRESAQKRGGHVLHFGLDFEVADRRYAQEPADDLTPQRVFERKWAIQVLDEVMEQMHCYYEQRDKLSLFEALKPALVQQQTESYQQIAGQLSMSEIAVKVAAHRMRQKYRTTLFEIIEQTVESKSEIEQEIADLFTALAPG